MGLDLNIHTTCIDENGKKETYTETINNTRNCYCDLLPSSQTLITEEYCLDLIDQIVQSMNDDEVDKKEYVRALGIVSIMYEYCGCMMSYS